MWHTSARISLDTERRSPKPERPRSPGPRTYEILRGASTQRSHGSQRARPGRPCGGQPHPEQTVDATKSPSSGLSMQQGELLSKREVVEHKLAPRPNRRPNRPVQSIREVRPRAACSTAAISASTYAIQFLPATTTCCRPPPPLSLLARRRTLSAPPCAHDAAAFLGKVA